MTIKSTSRAAAVLASLLLPAMALPNLAFAQTPAPVGDSSSATTKPKAPTAKAASPADRVEKHIADLHAELRITPAQQSEWDQFAQIMRENAANMDKVLEQRRAGFESMNAADNMQSYAEIAQQHAQDMQKLATTFKALYATLSDDQKKNADAVFRAHGTHLSHGKG
jgi:hypothetical protein